MDIETCRPEQPSSKSMGLYRSPLAIFFEGWDVGPPQIRFCERLPVTSAKVIATINVPSGVLERGVIRAGAKLTVFVDPDRSSIAAKRLSQCDPRIFPQVVTKRRAVRGRNFLANAKGQMNQGHDGKYRQDYQGPECDSPVPVGSDQGGQTRNCAFETTNKVATRRRTKLCDHHSSPQSLQLRYQSPLSGAGGCAPAFCSRVRGELGYVAHALRADLALR